MAYKKNVFVYTSPIKQKKKRKKWHVYRKSTLKRQHMKRNELS